MDVRVELWRKLHAEELMLSSRGTEEESWESLGQQEIKPVDPNDQPLPFIGRSDAEAPIIWPLDGKSQLIGKDPDAGRDWR